MISIRRRLLMGTVLAVALSSAVASGAAWFSVRAHLIAAADTDLQADAQRLLSQLRRRGEDLHWAGMGMGNATAPSLDGWWVVVDSRGSMRLSSADGAAFAQAGDGPVDMPDGKPGRIGHATGTVTAVGGRGRWDTETPSRNDTFTCLVGRADTALHSTLRAVAWALGTATAVAAILAGFAALVLVRTVIRPVDRIAQAIAASKPEDDRIAVDADSVPRELRGIVERADAFLAAAHDLLQRERRTAGNIAHELRTPLAGLAATIDHALARERAGAEYRQALVRSRAVVTDTIHMVERLLLLTRLESGREPARRENINIETALMAALAGVSAEARQRGVMLPDALKIPPHQVVGDPDHLGLILRNLLDNAVSHATDGAAVTVVCEQHGADGSLCIANPAPTLSPDQVAHLAEPFWRGDGGRGATGRHAGLGLALCRRLASLNGWELVCTSEAGVFTAALRTPMHDAMSDRKPSA